MIEKTSFEGRSLFPQSKALVFTIDAPVEKRKTPSGYPYYLFKTSTVVGGQRKKMTKAVMCFLSKPLLMALGFKPDEAGDILWDREQVVGKQFVADVVHAPDKKTGDMRDQWANFRAVGGAEEESSIPF